jgi:hypothetical protein
MIYEWNRIPCGGKQAVTKLKHFSPRRHYGWFSYETRPLICRLFDCDGEGKEQLIELGVLEREKE